VERASTRLEIKSVDADRRIITGIATTPTPDRHGDVIEPLGVTFNNPVPLLLHHDQKHPVGSVTFDAPTPKGITFTASLPFIADPGVVRDRVDEAWHSLKAGLLRTFSVGHWPNSSVIEGLRSGGRRFRQTVVAELSLVTIPANTEATLLTIKSATGGRSMTAGEHVTALENKRAALTARMTDILNTSGDEGATLEPEPAAEHDGLSVQVKSIDADLVRWRDLEKLQIQTAAPVLATTGSAFARVSVKPNVPIGTQFVRAACARMLERTGMLGSGQNAVTYAEERWKDTPEVALYLKAAVAPGTATDATWASPLVNQNIAKDFIELLRPATILGKIPGLRMVPFNTKVPSQSAGGTYGWVGESKPKPVTKLAFTSTSLGIAKAAGIIVLTKELIMLSDPNAEDLVRKDMIAGIAQFLDAQFVDPAVAAVAGVNPASITNGAPTAAATVNPLADIMGLINHFATNNIGVGGVTFIMSAANALALSFQTYTDGSPKFPGVSIDGGNYKGLNFVTSQAVTTNVIALQPALILYADGGIEIDASQEASLQMDSAPASPADATTVYVSLWQTNTVGLRAERFVNWAKANANAVKYLTAAAYPAPASEGVTRETNGKAAKA
jgi:HK97 family phage major capsid protein